MPTAKKRPASRTAARKAAPAKAAAPKPAPAKAAPPAAPAKPAASPRTATTATPPKPEKPKKPKLVRDSFTIPKAEFTVLQDLKQRAATLGAPAKKSELLRAGIKSLAAMGDAAFRAALGAVPAIKTGRPTKG